jgi:hypothetical protein
MILQDLNHKQFHFNEFIRLTMTVSTRRPDLISNNAKRSSACTKCKNSEKQSHHPL